jgi:hypothetical protein
MCKILFVYIYIMQRGSDDYLYSKLQVLWYAAEKGNIGEVIGILSDIKGQQYNIDDHGAMLPEYDEYRGISPLYIAAYEGHNDIVKLLINETNSDINFRMKNSKSRNGAKGYIDGTPLIAAINMRHDDVVETLINAGGIIFSFLHAVEIDNMEAVKYLVDNPRVNIALNKAIYIAKKTNNYDMITYLMNKEGKLRTTNPELFCFESHPYCNTDNTTCYKTAEGAANRDWNQQKSWTGNNKCLGNHSSAVAGRGVARSMALNASIEKYGGRVRKRLISKRKKRLFKKKSKRKNTKRNVKRNTMKKKVR